MDVATKPEREGGREANTDGGRGDESEEECRMDGGRRREPLGRMPSCPAN